MSVITIIGATGVIGREAAAALVGQGHEVRAASRSGPYPVDLTTGAGLPEALAGADAVVNAANGPPRDATAVLIEGTRRLLAAAAAAGVGHYVDISIVGIEQVGVGYYRVKVEQERLVSGAAVPWTIVRSTQFHELVAGGLDALARRRLAVGSGIPLQPVAAAEAGAAVAEVALAPPRRARVTIAGPEVRSVTELSEAHRRALGRRLIAVPVPLPPRLGRSLRAGALTCADPDHRGQTTFAQWLSRRS